MMKAGHDVELLETHYHCLLVNIKVSTSFFSARGVEKKVVSEMNSPYRSYHLHHFLIHRQTQTSNKF